MIKLEEVVVIQKMIIEKFGGNQGVRDKKALQSVLESSSSMIDGKELYPSPTEKAAAILEGIIKQTPFFDGNKRTAYVLMRLVLIRNKMDIRASDDEKYRFVMQIASGEMYYTDMVHWISERIISL